ncbi:MAG: sigma-70 family RNA polymerase sigma factor [Candidatus Glassbacteria bacterium]|nr:sigma-70 family RNA polymerase sigma factor [Candidatus Glassbacteria bacterium]
MGEDIRSLLAAYQDKVYNQAYRMLGNREEADEASQDVFLRIHRSLDEFRGESKLSSWIFRITANVCISRLRKKQLEVASIDETLDSGDKTVAELIPDDQPDPSEQYASLETAEMIRAQVRRLPANWAQAISLHHFQGMSYDEVAEVMEIPRATVATYILRGRRQLARQLTAALGKDELSY